MEFDGDRGAVVNCNTHQDYTMFTESNGGRDMTLPERLKAAREERGWTIEEVGAQLKLPARVIARVEQGDFDGLGAPIYRRGYLRSFARLVGVPDDEIQVELVEQTPNEPELIATGVMPRSEYMFERYLRPATYIALTALIALPVVWWAASGQLGQELAERRSFDLQPPPLSSSASDTANIEPERPQPLPLGMPPNQTELVRASMMSVPPTADSLDTDETVVATASEAPAGVSGENNDASHDVIGTGANEAVLELAAKSWVEVTEDGRRLHQALLSPGQWRYRSDGRLSFTIGNSQNARLTAQGDPIDLDAHRSPNDVARVELFAEGG